MSGWGELGFPAWRPTVWTHRMLRDYALRFLGVERLPRGLRADLGYFHTASVMASREAVNRLLMAYRRPPMA